MEPLAIRPRCQGSLLEAVPEVDERTQALASISIPKYRRSPSQLRRGSRSFVAKMRSISQGQEARCGYHWA